MANKLKTGNIMIAIKAIKKSDGSMINDWQKTVNEIMNHLFLKENEAIVGDRLPTAEAGITELANKRIYKYTKAQQSPRSKLGINLGIKIEIYQKISDITASLLIQIINDCFKRGYFLNNIRKQN